MQPVFDPEDRRRSWLEFFLDFHAKSDPESVHPRARGHYSSCEAGGLVGAVRGWLGRRGSPDGGEADGVDGETAGT